MSDKEEVDFKSLVEKKSQKSAELETKQISTPLFVKSVDEKHKRITAVASTGNIDRDGEIIDPEAFKESLPMFMKNNVVLAAHQHRLSDGSSPVVANIVEANVTKTGLEVVLEFHNITKLSNEYWELYRLGKQKALSVGFISLEGGNENRNGKSIYVHRKLELLEVSLVAVPSNPQALTRSQQKKQDFVASKIIEREEERFKEEVLAEERRENPSFDKDCEDFSEMILDYEDDEAERDFAAIVRGEEENEFVRLIKGH